MNPTERTFSHTAFLESIGDFTSILCLRMFMMFIRNIATTLNSQVDVAYHELIAYQKGLMLKCDPAFAELFMLLCFTFRTTARSFAQTN